MDRSQTVLFLGTFERNQICTTVDPGVIVAAITGQDQLSCLKRTVHAFGLVGYEGGFHMTRTVYLLLIMLIMLR